MSNHLMDGLPFLRQLYRAKGVGERRKILQSVREEQMKLLVELALNFLKGNLVVSPAEMKKLVRYKNEIRLLGGRKGNLIQKRRLLIQTGGGFLSFLIAPLLKLGPSVLSDVIFKKEPK